MPLLFFDSRNSHHSVVRGDIFVMLPKSQRRPMAIGDWHSSKHQPFIFLWSAPVNDIYRVEDERLKVNIEMAKDVT